MHHPQTSVTIDRVVEWVDTDAAGHHHNSVIIRWVEAAEAELMRRLGLPDYFPTAPRVQQIVNFREKLRFGQGVSVHLWVERVGSSSLTLGFEVAGRPSDGGPARTAADGSVTTVHVPYGAAGSTPWPEAVRAVLTAEPR